jgi:hypothetical protein
MLAGDELKGKDRKTRFVTPWQGLMTKTPANNKLDSFLTSGDHA